MWVTALRLPPMRKAVMWKGAIPHQETKAALLLPPIRKAAMWEMAIPHLSEKQVMDHWSECRWMSSGGGYGLRPARQRVWDQRTDAGTAPHS